MVALDVEFAVLPVETFGADHPASFLVRDGLGKRVTRVNADLAGCSVQQEKKNLKLLGRDLACSIQSTEPSGSNSRSANGQPSLGCSM